VDAALAAYQGLYPSGHNVISGETWKKVIAKVTAQTGDAISILTLREALKIRKRQRGGR
jgi:hypothetical protein